MQNSDAEDIFEQMDALEREFGSLLENPIVDDFLKTEVAFCRMMQEVNVMIAESLNFN